MSSIATALPCATHRVRTQRPHQGLTVQWDGKTQNQHSETPPVQTAAPERGAIWLSLSGRPGGAGNLQKEVTVEPTRTWLGLPSRDRNLGWEQPGTAKFAGGGEGKESAVV